MGNDVIFSIYDPKACSKLGRRFALKLIDEFQADESQADKVKLEFIPCDDGEIKKWKKAGYLIYDVSLAPIDIGMSFDGLKVDDCQEPVRAAVSAVFGIVPGEDLAQFVLTALDENGKTKYTKEDLEKDLVEKFGMRSLVRHILAGKNINLLEKYGKNAVDWSGLEEQLPPFLAIEKINLFDISTAAEDDNVRKALEARAEAAELQMEENEQALRRKVKEMQQTYQCEVKIAELNSAKVQALYAVELAKSTARTERLVQGFKNQIALIHAMDSYVKAIFDTAACKIVILILLLAALVFAGKFGWRKWNEFKLEKLRQQPELLIEVVGYGNSKQLFDSDIWKNLSGHFPPPKVSADKVIFRGTMSGDECRELVGYLHGQQKKSFIELLAIPEEKLPRSPYNLSGYELRIKKQRTGRASIVVIGNINADKIRDFIYENWGFAAEPKPLPDKKDALMYVVTTNIGEIITMKGDIQKKFGLDDDDIDCDTSTNTVTIYLSNDAMRNYVFDIRDLSTGKLAIVRTILKKAAFDPGSAKIVCRQNKITDYRKQLDDNNIDWIEGKETKDGFQVTLRERRPVFTYTIDVIAKRPGASAEMAKIMAKDKVHFISVVPGKEGRVGVKYLSKISITTFIATREELEPLLPVPSGAKIVK